MSIVPINVVDCFERIIVANVVVDCSDQCWCCCLFRKTHRGLLVSYDTVVVAPVSFDIVVVALISFDIIVAVAGWRLIQSIKNCISILIEYHGGVQFINELLSYCVIMPGLCLKVAKKVNIERF